MRVEWQNKISHCLFIKRNSGKRQLRQWKRETNVVDVKCQKQNTQTNPTSNAWRIIATKNAIFCKNTNCKKEIGGKLPANTSCSSPVFRKKQKDNSVGNWELRVSKGCVSLLPTMDLKISVYQCCSERTNMLLRCSIRPSQGILSIP